MNAYEKFGNNPVTLAEYSDLLNLSSISNDDCFCQIHGNGRSVEEYFQNNFNNIEFSNPQPNFNVWKHFYTTPDVTLEIIKNNETLSRINAVLEISVCSFMEISPNSWLAWHYDFPRKGPALNLLLTPESRSHSLFSRNITDTSNLVECKYQPHQFCLYNTEIIHSILNFENPRYLFSAVFKRGQEDLSWTEAKEIFSSIGLI
jgi:hypothetical protein